MSVFGSKDVFILGAKGLGMTEVQQCDWKCPICGRQCDGVKDHPGEHQCLRHFKPKEE